MRVSRVIKDAVAVPTGTRTKKLVAHLADKLERAGIDRDRAEAQPLEIAKSPYAKMDNRREQETSVLRFMSEEEQAAIANVLQDESSSGTEPDIKNFVKALVKQLANRT